MGRPLNPRLFGANASSNLKVQFFNGTSSVPGYIVKQYGSERFKCRDSNGNTAICKMVAKASGDLEAGEMSITVRNDAGDALQLTKIFEKVVTVAGQRTPWTFDPSNSDARVQMEEAGINTDLDDKDDFEGDEINGDYPVPGSGNYRTAAVALSGITYANKGTPYAPGSEVDTVYNQVDGLRRSKYDGNFTATSSSAPSTWDYSFFDTADLIKTIADEDVSWGQQIDGPGRGESLFSIEWTGYVQVPTTQNYNFYAESDDHIAMWIGDAATGAPANNTRLLGSANKVMPGDANTAGVANANSVTLTAGKWYPIRIWFSEHQGGCKAQIYAQGADGTKFNGRDLTFAHDIEG